MQLDEKIILGNCLDVLPTIPRESVDLVFADPPFNIGFKYNNHKDNLSDTDYIEFSKSWLEMCYYCLKPNGSIYVAMADEYVAEICLIMKSLGLVMRNWIIWHYTFGQCSDAKFSRCHTHILYFVKNGTNFTFNAKDILIKSARLDKYNDPRGKLDGKVPSDVWEMPRICGNFKERVKGHPCQMPEEILRTIIKTSSYKNSLVLDPFGGSGTTAVMARDLGRDFIVIEIDPSYHEIIKKRVSEPFDLTRYI